VGFVEETDWTKVVISLQSVWQGHGLLKQERILELKESFYHQVQFSTGNVGKK
jgi:hypothetical protein